MLSLAKKRATFGNFQRNYLYMITASRIPPKLSQLVSGTIGDGINIDVYNDSIFFPDHKTEEITVQVSGEKFLIPGVDGSTKVSEFSFYDDENQNIYNFFKGCKEQTGTQKNNANLGGDGPSGLDFSIIKFSSDKENMVLNAKRLIDCKIYSVTSDGFAKGNNGLNKWKVRIGWDNVEDFNPDPSAVASHNAE
jgi:hypothetical protein